MSEFGSRSSGWASASALGILVLSAACGRSEPGAASPEALDTAGLAEAAATITEADLRSRVAVLAADSMRGRDTPSPELDQAAEWIAREFAAMGLEPAFAGDFIQTYGIRRIVPDPEASIARVADGRALAFEDEIAFTMGVAEGRLEGGVAVLVGTRNVEDVLRTDRIRGRHVVWVPESGAHPLRTREGRLVVRTVRGQGGLSLLVANDDDERAWRSAAGLGAQLTALTLEGQAAALPGLSVRDAALARVLGIDVDALRAAANGAARIEEHDARLTLDLAVRVVAENRAPNVAAVLQGADPELRDEYVVYSAHMDHVGVGAPDATGDSIWNGADDDASGTAAVMEVAQAFASMDSAPRRSLLFLLVSGEEKGLWGSRFFVENPPVPVSWFVAALNADMVGRNWPDTIVAIGREHSDLGATLATVNAAHPELGMTAIDDLWPEENFYGRSDHFNFARRGVPILFFFNGTHEDYHRPSDEVERIDAEKAARIGQLLFYLGVEIASRDERPRWAPASYERIVQPN